MSIASKEVIDRTVGRENTLRVTRGFEAPHLPLFLPTRLVRVLSPIIPVLARLMLGGKAQFPVGRTVAPQLVRNDLSGRILQPFE